jgi:glycosyltransferase involved in cell wall biosynthesis
VHTHFVNLLSLDVIAAALYPGVKVVFSEHASDVSKARTSLRWRLLQASNLAASSLVDQVIAPSHYVRSRLLRGGVSPSKAITVYNGVNLTRFQDDRPTGSARSKYGIPANRMLVVSISQVIPEKGLPDLMAAAALIIREGRKVSFVHVGDGPGLAEYRQTVRSLGIENDFIFTGLLDLPEVAAVLCESDVFTLPCTWGEAFSLAVLEAMAAGKPVVVTRTGGNVEAVDDGGNGLVVPPGDTGALARAFLFLEKHPDQRLAMGQEGTRRSTYFSVDRWVGETMDVYRRLLPHEAPRPVTA